MKTHIQHIVRSLFYIGPHAGAHRVAIRAAACLAIPLLTLYALGRMDLSLYATFGAFAAVYGRDLNKANRLSMQTLAGGAILVSMLIGTLLVVLDAPSVGRLFAVSLIATLVTLIADWRAWRPPGAIFCVFAAGACASIPATSATFVHVLVVGGGTVAFCLLITIVFAPEYSYSEKIFTTPTRAESRANAARIALATLLAGLGGLLLDGDHWYWAMVAAIAALTGPDVHARVTRGIGRLVGTVAGVVIAAFVMWLDPPVIAIIAIAIVSQGVIELVILRNYAIAMLFITTTALLMVHMASMQSPGTIIRNRVLETLIGVTIGMAVAVLSHTRQTRFEPGR